MKGKKFDTVSLRNAILRLYRSQPKKRLNARQVIKALNLANNTDSVNDALQKLTQEGILSLNREGKFRLAKGLKSTTENRATGYVDMTRSGNAYIVCDGMEKDIFVHLKKLNTALDGDHVEVAYRKVRTASNPSGEVVKVLKRATDFFIGSINISEKYAYFIPDKEKMPVDIFIPLDKVGAARTGDKVVVRVTEWKSKEARNPKGEVVSILSDLEDDAVQMQAILINHGFPVSFPDEVLDEIKDLPEGILPEEMKGRRDFRKLNTLTIDPADAKDFDDAISVEHFEDGTYEIGVHIADVSHYVKPGTALDKEAYNRSTSVYLVGGVLPMLPEKLSNALCSLRPDEDSLTFSGVFTFNSKDELVKSWFGKGIIHSFSRFTYEDAQEIIEGATHEFSADVIKLNELAKKLRAKRFREGSIGFESPELKFTLDEQGKPTFVSLKKRFDAHKLVEEFMLLANKEVARYITEKGKEKEIPFVYRIHDSPDMAKVEEFAVFAKHLGFSVDVSSTQAIVKSYNKLMEASDENPALGILESLAIRTMAKAVYAVDNIGHFGLGFEYYSHFTSPIRRYADVLVHRYLDANLSATFRTDKEILQKQCVYISAQERKATEAERESIKYKQAEYINQFIGHTFEGFVSGMIDKGFFVTMQENFCEGFVPFLQFDEPYDVSPDRLKAVAKYSRQTFRMGQEVRVTVIHVDMGRKQVDLEWVETEEA